jgi:hypothetical protein
MNEEVKIVHEMEDDPTVSRDEIVNCFVLPPSSLCNNSAESFISGRGKLVWGVF